MAIVGFSLAFSTALGWAAIATSLTVKNRHIRHLMPMLLYAMMFVLPVFYSVQNFESTVIQTAYQLNPIAGAMDCLRAGFHSAEIGVLTISSWFLQSAAWMIIGIAIFRKTERNLADKV